MQQRDLFSLPSDLPVPKNDGACDHLVGAELPDIVVTATTGRNRNLREIADIPTVFFFYPRTGRPEEPAPKDWDLIPGARGCTPQSCGFRDLHSEFKKRGINVYAVSSQSTDYQQEFAKRNEIPFDILSDENFEITNTLKLPTFEYSSMRLIKRMALFVNHGRIIKVFYPVFPPDQNSTTVLDWIDRGENERKVAALWYSMGAQKWDSARNLLADGFICAWPQSKELFTKADDFIAMNQAYPGKHNISVRRLETSGDSVVFMVHIKSSDPEQEVWATSFFDFESGLISKVTEFWSDPYEAPEWRTKWREKL